MGGPIRWPITRYAVALGSVAAAYLLARWLWPEPVVADGSLAVHPSGVPLFLVAVVVSAWAGGFRAAVLATAVSVVGIVHLSIRAHGSGSDAPPAHLTPVDLVWTGCFLIVAAAYTALARSRWGAEAALRDRDVRLRLVSEQIPAGLWSTDQELRLTSRFGSGPHGADVINLFDALPRGTTEAEQYPPIAAHLRALEGESSTYEVAFEDRTFQCHVEPLRNGVGETIGVVGVALDISDRKEAEDRMLQAKRVAEVATQAKDQFLAMLSHELRTPLTPALAAASVLEGRMDLPEDVREDVEMIRRNVQLQARLIDDLLDLTRIAKGKMQLSVQTCDAHELVRSALDICRTDLQGKQLQVTVDLAAAEHVVRADEARLQQVFWNLIKNAVKFTNPGGRITLRSVNDGRRVRVEVIDNGVGIDEEVMPRIFNTFEQGRDQVTRNLGGLGLGLAISKALIDAHGGTLTATSAGRGRGATFAVELDTIPAAQPAAPPQPAAPAPLAAAGAASPPAPVPAAPVPAAPVFPVAPVIPVTPVSAVEPAAAGEAHPRFRSLKILLVEDHRDTLRTLTRLLRGMGHGVETASSVTDALAVADRAGAAFDLVISDIGLPDGTGLELMRRLTERRPVKGIALSGYGMDTDIQQSRAAGFVTHLTKPIDFQRLEAVIEEVGAMPHEAHAVGV